MSLIVQKFGGTSVADTERLKNVADIVTSTAKAGNQVVVVVSAQGDTTDDLIEKAAELNERPSRREMDVLLNTGEMISMSLLAMAIQKLGFPVVSLTGWQIGMETNSNYSDARIKRISGDRLKAELDNGRIVIVAGFQGINKMGDVTTLGRGGSDTTAVAIAATLGADLCQIYTDVDGVYTADPRIVKNARKMKEITYYEMLEMARLGAGVMQPRSVEMGKYFNIPIHVRSTFTNKPGTIIREDYTMEDKDFVIRGKKLGEKNKLLHALSNVSFDIYKGETLGIIGESGCGKSTLGRCLVKLHKPSGGTITYNGKDLWNMPVYDREAARRDIQMIFQDPYSSLDPRKTASYSIEEAMKVHHIGDTARERRQKALEYLQEVGLDIQHMERYPHEFSGGQRQRVNIARALSMEPKIIVCDEPVSALDVSIQAQVINLFRRLQKQFNLTYVFISHDLGIIKYISDRIMIMYLGRVMEFYTSEGIYADPKHPYTQALLSAIPPESPFEKKERLPLTGDIPSPIGDQVGCPLAGRCPHCTEHCKKEIPKLVDTGDGHMVACFLYE